MFPQIDPGWDQPRPEEGHEAARRRADTTTTRVPSRRRPRLRPRNPRGRAGFDATRRCAKTNTAAGSSADRQTGRETRRHRHYRHPLPPMKRPPPTSIPELPAPPPQARAQRRRAGMGKRRRTDQAGPKASHREGDNGFTSAEPPTASRSTPAAKSLPSAPAPRPEARRQRRWRCSAAASVAAVAGRAEIDARLDLHGMIQTRPTGAVGLLQRAQHEGMTFVLIITGKGRIGRRPNAVLRRQVPQWLNLPNSVRWWLASGSAYRPWRQGALCGSGG